MTDETTNELAKSYEFANCPISLNLQIFPEDGSPEGRRILIGIRNHQDAPIFKSIRAEDFGCIQDLINELLTELKAQLPIRLAAAIQQQTYQMPVVNKVEKPEESKSAKPKKAKPALVNIDVLPATDGVATEIQQTKLDLFGEK